MEESPPETETYLGGLAPPPAPAFVLGDAEFAGDGVVARLGELIGTG